MVKTMPANPAGACAVARALPDPNIDELIVAHFILLERQFVRLERTKPQRRTNMTSFCAENARTLEGLVRLFERLLKCGTGAPAGGRSNATASAEAKVPERR
jgi:hypothetical protein